MKIKRGDIRNAVLATIKIAGLLAVATLAPNVLQILKTNRRGRELKNSKYYIKTVIEKLKDDGLIELQQDGESQYFVLTKNGAAKLAIHEKTNFLESSNRDWDGKWRVVIFDINESKRATRDRLRERLTDIGFVKIQNSVWIFPYDCEEFIFLLKTDFELGRNVLFMTVDKLENDKWICRKFGLTPIY